MDRTEHILDFVAMTARTQSLVGLLDESPARIATILDADVCSIYLREGNGETLVLTGHGDSTTIGAEAPHRQEWIDRGH